MIDWLGLKIPVQHSPIKGNKTLVISPDGELIGRWTDGLNTLGSFESSIYLSTIFESDDVGAGTILYFNGNPAKFLQGHNVFGINDVNLLVYRCLLRIEQIHKLGINLLLLRNVIASSKITRVDINKSFNVGSIERVRSFIQALEFKAKTRHGKSQLTGNTLYFGKKSKKWTIKIYSKYDELKSRSKKHYLDVKIFTEKQIQLLEQFSEKTIRIELTLRSEELKKPINQISYLRDLTVEKINNIYKKYIGRLEMTEQIKLEPVIVHKIPRNVRSTYRLWADGYDLRNELTKATYYRHRKILKEFNIDIALTIYKEEKLSNVVPLITIIEAKSVGIPDWAYTERLIVNSNQSDLFNPAPALSII
jgi:II/X family phage/plasmid replication protein